ncbi:hypothetical protein COP2_025340 [Malus domestica]
MAQVDFNYSTYLSPEQLRKIARILYYQEAEAIKNIQFEYEAILVKYLRHCKACYESVIRLMDSDTKLEPCIGEHVDGLPAHLDDVLTNKELELARKAFEFRNDMMEIARGSQSPAGVPQNHICIRAGKYQCNRVLLGAAGIAVLIFSAGIVWEIFSANNSLQTVARDAVTITTSIGGAMIREVVGVALVSMLTDNGLLVLKAGITAGIAGVFLIGEFTTQLINVTFGSGGDAPLSTMGHRCYVAQLPDGSVLARQIAHQQSEEGEDVQILAGYVPYCTQAYILSMLPNKCKHWENMIYK